MSIEFIQVLLLIDCVLCAVIIGMLRGRRV